jgi:uncharacterized protein (DUF2235 family)
VAERFHTSEFVSRKEGGSVSAADRQFDLVSSDAGRERSSEPKSEVRLRAEAAMARKLVVCCDGTWNTPRKNTNVYRTYTFLRDRLVAPKEVAQKDGVTTCSGKGRDGTEVMLFYDRGVGTNWFTHLLGGGVGAGLSDNVRDAYSFLARNFTPGAEIYIFGFSRGAYTARSLCGFIKAAGLLDRPSEVDVARTYVDCYITADHLVATPDGWNLDRVRRRLVEHAGEVVGRVGRDVATLPRHAGVKIKFIGVYDTVGALGVPLAGTERINEPIVGFHDTGFADLIDHAVHALAVDERRGPYVPTLWTLATGTSLLPTQSVLQVWFPGVHSDVGGGYTNKEIGNITWDFMMRQAARRGLVVDPAEPTPRVDIEALPAQHESFDDKWKKLSAELRCVPEGVRAVGPTVTGPNGQTLKVAGDVRLHPSVADRLGKDCTTILAEAPDRRSTGPYAPANVKANCLPLFAN